MDGQAEPRTLATDYKALGKRYGEQFGNGIKGIKDTVASAYASAEKGFPLDTLTFVKMLTPTLANCQFPHEKYLAAAEVDSTFLDWETGFMEGCIKNANTSKQSIEKIIDKYAEINMTNVSDLENIQKAFDIAVLMGGRQAKLAKQKVL